MATPTVSNKEVHNVVPRKVPQEMITPYKLTVAVLIKCYCQFRVSGKEFYYFSITTINVLYHKTKIYFFTKKQPFR